jgi:hypothetical protein
LEKSILSQLQATEYILQYPGSTELKLDLQAHGGFHKEKWWV